MLRLTGAAALMLTETNPDKWKKHLRKEDGRSVIYVVCNKAIYITMNAALLACKELANLLSSWEFTMNPYESCLWNKDINKKQMSILFHIDDLIISHLNPVMVTLYIKKLKKEYRKLEVLTVCQGLVHGYIGQTVDFRKKGEVRFSQFDCIRKLYESLPEDMKIGHRNTAAPSNLF